MSKGTNRQHLYRETAAKVERIIQTRMLRPHDPVPSEAELAAMFGISRMTAKLALDLLARQGRVYRLKRRGTFLAETESARLNEDGTEIPDSAADASAGGARGDARRRIAFVLPVLDSYTSRLVSALETAARAFDSELMIRLSKDAADEEASLKQLASEVDGILLFARGRETMSPAALELRESGFPIVLIDRLFTGAAMDFVVHDSFQGMYDMVKRFIEAGHREIGFVTNPIHGVSSIDERYKGYLKALIDHEIPVQSQYILAVERVNSQTHYWEGNPEMEGFLKANRKLTAVACGDDYLAAAVYYTAVRMNKSVPEDLSLSGFSDSELAQMLPVPLTTVAQPADELARRAVQTLLDRMHGKGGKKPVTVKIKTKIIERMSLAVHTGIPRLRPEPEASGRRKLS
ncbi:GntR family transcriptional regulator [Paenibacillus sp. MWE-103]|uniref:GntR family transcriptional regulator n=1 Tax=Paenibacillus artemisiicola TaxID=1172618 RepID=A0ABS3W8S0_9BACL|nr:GntR family transcriptional regulator [Paenibacillus artemisiicola]MBO7744673.1 GntR family transcriptional regulator [Paenibacillus artemisiicola]